MFKRYSKGTYEDDFSAQVVDGDSGEGPSQSGVAVQGDHSQGATTYHPSSQEEFIRDGAPPRVFEGRGGGVGAASYYQQQMQQQEYGKQRPSEAAMPNDDEEQWPEKIASLPASPFHMDNFDGEEPETVLGEGVTFKGELSFKRFLRIDGHFEGELKSEGKLIVGPRGVVKSNIKMHEVIIEGYVEGNIISDERVELRSDAQVYGDITARILSVDEGVTLVGTVSVKPESGTYEAAQEDADSK